MGRAQTADGSRHYRLRGVVGEVDCSFSLRRGDNLVGSRADCHIVLTDSSVSRRHARIAIVRNELLLEDLDSKNGTFVNGRRVASAALAAGDTVRFGGVTLELQLVEAADADLAIAVDTPATDGLPPVVEAGSTLTVAAEMAAAGGPWMTVLERVLDALRADGGEISPALGTLARELGLETCLTARLEPAGEPVVLAAVGHASDLLRQPAVRDLLRRAGRKRGARAVSSSVLPGAPTVACAAISGVDREPFVLVAAGERLGYEHLGLLRVLVRLLEEPVAAGGADAASPREMTGLVVPPGYVTGRSPAMTTLYREMRPLVQGDLPVLVTGETGVGKEHVAHILHLSSPRRRGPFVAINCAALPADLLEAELFGIGRGVATGVEERVGRFQQAEGGVLLLDEIADMSPNLQAKLLRALQEREVHPVGGKRSLAVDVRVIAATNADPLVLVREGRLRADLYYRIAGSVLRVPPLRERRGDIGALVEHFVQLYATETGKTVRGVTVAALAALEHYPWPGNVRELEHEVRRMVYLCPHGQAVDSTLLPSRALAGPAVADEEPLTLAARLAQLEAQLVRQALAQSAGNRTQAARLLGISRNGLAIKMERLGIGAPGESALE